MRRVTFELGISDEREPLRRRVERFPYVPAERASRNERCEEVYNIQVHGLETRLRATGIEKVVIGVSGGLDSTHALIVVARALDRLGLPRENVLAYTMPGFATGDHTKSNAWKLMKALGVTGEVARLEEHERATVLDIVVNQAAGRVPIIAGTSAEGTRTCIAYTRQARDLGAAAVMVSPPRMPKLNSNAVVAHYKALADAVDLPIIVQDYPPITGFAMEPSLLARIDFLSIGTNDLAQFLFACDRGNPRLADRYDLLSAPMVALFRDVIAKCAAAGVPLSMCGEMAGNPIEAMMLIGLGFRTLSITATARPVLPPVAS